MPQGNDDTTVASRKILDGSAMVTGDFDAPPAIIKQALDAQQGSDPVRPGRRRPLVALNTSEASVRRHQRPQGGRGRLRPQRAAARARRQDRRRHPDARHPAGRRRLRGGRRHGGTGLRLPGQARGRPRAGGRVLQEGGHELGQVRGHRRDPHDRHVRGRRPEGGRGGEGELREARLQGAAAARHAGRDVHEVLPRPEVADIDVCPNVGWFKDFSDPQTMLSPTFDGKNILPQNNSNMSVLDVPEINAAHDQGGGAHRSGGAGRRSGPRSTSWSPTRRRPSPTSGRRRRSCSPRTSTGS